MGFLSALFDPVGALATGSTDNSSFNSAFNPGENLFGNDGLGWEPSGLSNFNSNTGNTVDNFAGNVVDANLDELKNLGNHFKSNPSQLLTGVDPASTSFWNKATNQDNKPWLDQWGGETKQDFQNSANRGVNVEDNGYMSALAHMIASYYATSKLGDLGAGAYAAEFPSEATSVAADGTGGAGSSALDMGWETSGASQPAAAGSGSSQAGWSSQGLDKGLAGVGAGGPSFTKAAGNTFNGAVQGGANALDNNQNPFAGFAKGGLQAGIGSNLDYAGAAGIDDPLYKGAVNGAVTGGLRSGMNDTSNTGYGALVGLLGGLAKPAGQAVSNYFSQPTSGGTPGSGSGTTNWGNIATGLGNLYMARRNDAGIQGQINNLNALYAPNSPYAKQMQQTLDRQDAAGGRRSQYGTRSVELQARLADAASRNAPTLANLYGQQRQNRFNQYAGLLTTGRNSGMFGGGQQQPGFNYNNSPDAGYGSIPGGSGVAGFQGNNPSSYVGGQDYQDPNEFAFSNFGE